MNQAPSLWLRRYVLLLLVPWLLAGTPSVMPMPIPVGAKLVFVVAPAEFPAGQCLRLEMEIHDPEGMPVTPDVLVPVTLSSTNPTGQFHDSPDCQSPPVSQVEITSSAPKKQFWYRAIQLGDMTIYASDPGPLIDKTYPTRVVPGPLAGFSIEGFPPAVTANTEHGFTVSAVDEFGNVKTNFTGRVFVELTDLAPGAGVFPDAYHTFTVGPGGDNGFAEFSARFVSAGPQSIIVKDVQDPSITSSYSGINVLPGPPARLEITVASTLVRAGEAATFQLHVLDEVGNIAKDYVGRVEFTSSEPGATLPPPTDFEQGDQGQRTFAATFFRAGAQTLTARDSVDASLQAQATIEVGPGDFQQISASASPSGPVDACTVVRIDLAARDAYDNIVPGPRQVTLCRSAGSSAHVTSHTLERATSTEECITGDLPASGLGQVSLKASAEERVTFTLSGSTGNGSSVTVQWQPARFRPERSTLSFEDAEPVPSLRVQTGELRLWFEPRDSCDRPTELPAAGLLLAFVAEAPLEVLGPPERESDGRWRVEVRLPTCPSNAQAPLRITPTLNGEPITQQNNELLERLIQPLCLPPDVQLSLSAVLKGQQVAPGQAVSFRVDLRNEGPEDLPEGVLRLETEGLTVLGVSEGEEALERHDLGFKLPELDAASTLSLKVEAEVSLETEQPVKVSAWYATLEGTPLTERQSLSVEREPLGVDVGCSSQPGAAPAVLLALLALLAATSRPRAPSHRLGRGERIDLQE